MSKDCKKPHCERCGKEIPADVADDCLCYGCKKYICEECDNLREDCVMGQHEFSDHKFEGDDKFKPRRGGII